MAITLKTLKDATEQEVFDQAAKHLMTQKAKSLLSKACAYRGDNGMMCAAGVFIPDSEYSPVMEDCSWLDLVDGGWVTDSHSHLIDRLQTIHDNYTVDKWLEFLQRLAESYELSTEVLGES